ncbi:unnamed protein product [Peronospora belbahrii]|uniref:DNA/RNA-binding protein Kin17 WH-like domain-containing protein n=1 Tax=Peronospora belbahrii TaxID=622444 RepID=A0AAU9KV22_9STRA|nr:unnamed protein product [Peronospora belbahrii]
MSGYSELFEEAFLENLRRRHGTKRMRATHVYNEYIADKMHIHMNATQWETLGSFVQYLGRTGKCVVDETEKGWHLQYIDRDPKAIARQKELEKKKKAELDHEERNRLFIERQLKIASENETVGTMQQPTKLLRGENRDKIRIVLKKEGGKKESDVVGGVAEAATVFGGENQDEDKKIGERTTSVVTCLGKRHAVDTIMEEEERYRNEKSRRLEDESKRLRKENWVTTGLVVKVTNKKVGDSKYYKCKGVVKDVQDKFCATVKLLDSGDVLRLDQDDLETVIPKPGRKVKIVNGLGRGCTAKLLTISVADFCARIRIDSGPHRGEILDRVEYEDICRHADE